MPLLRDQADDLAALASAAAAYLGIPQPGFVEKDYWVVELLRSVTRPLQLSPLDGVERSAQVLFKGGTSLSKAYGLIDRFSEDVDILVICQGLGRGARDSQVLRPICDRAIVDLGRSENEVTRLDSKSGFTRNVLYGYSPRLPALGLNPQVKLEMGIRGGTLPGTVMCVVRSYIAEYIDQVGIDAEFDELAPVEVGVIAPVRTLAEKLALLHHAGVLAASGSTKTLDAAGRHIYDIYRLLSDDGVIATLNITGSQMTDLAPDVDAKSAEYGWGHTARPEGGYSKSVIFDPSGPVWEIAKQAFADAQLLIWGTVPTFEECLAVISQEGHLL